LVKTSVVPAYPVTRFAVLENVKQVLTALFVRQLFRVGQNTIIDEIRAYFLKVSDEIDDN